MPQKGTHPATAKAAKVGFIWVALSKAQWLRGGSEAGPGAGMVQLCQGTCTPSKLTRLGLLLLSTQLCSVPSTLL